MAICANAPWLSDLVSELYAELQVLDPNMGGLDLSFCIINKAPSAWAIWWEKLEKHEKTLQMDK